MGCGASLAAARRAGRYGLGLLANGGEVGMREAYESASLQHGHEPGTMLVARPGYPNRRFRGRRC